MSYTKEEILEQADYIKSMALGFTNPEHEPYYAEWSSVHEFAENTKDYFYCLVNDETPSMNKEELLSRSEVVRSTALNFTHPYFEDVHHEWGSIYSFAEHVEEYFES